MSEITTYEKTKDSGIEWIGSVPSHWRVHTLYQLVTQVKEKNSNLQEKNLLSLSYGKIKRKDIDSPDGLLPASFDGYNIIERWGYSPSFNRFTKRPYKPSGRFGHRAWYYYLRLYNLASNRHKQFKILILPTPCL